MAKPYVFHIKHEMNKNIAVYGASGSMKSRAFARNMIFQCVARGQEGNNASGESLIITDPKSELYEACLLIWKMRAM